MPRIDNQTLPTPDLRTFTTIRPRVDTSVADLITGVADIAEQTGATLATQGQLRNVTEQAEDFIAGRQAQAELSEIQPTSEQFFETAEGEDVSEDVVAFRDRVQTLQQAARAGEISTTELKMRIRADMRAAIRDNPFFAPEIEDAANTAMGRYSEILDFYEQQDRTSANNEQWLLRQIIQQAPALGVNVGLLATGDPNDSQEFYRQLTVSMAVKQQKVLAEAEKTMRDNLDASDTSSDKRLAPQSVLGDMVDIKARLVNEFQVPVNDPTLYREWFDTTDENVKAAIIQNLNQDKTRYAAVFNAKYPNITASEREDIMSPYMAYVDNTIAMMKGEITADALKLMNDIAIDSTLNLATKTKEGRIALAIGTRMPNVDPSHLLGFANIWESTFDTLMNQDNYSSQSPANRAAISNFQKNYLPDAINELLGPTETSKTAAARQVMTSFVSSTNALSQANQLDSEELRSFYEIAANPVIADLMNQAGAGNEAEKVVMKANFTRATQNYLSRLRQSWRQLKAGNPDIMVNAAAPDGSISWMMDQDVPPTEQARQRETLDTLNRNHAVHLNTIIRGLAHLEGGKSADDYRTARGLVLDILNSTQGPAGVIRVTRDDNGELNFGDLADPATGEFSPEQFSQQFRERFQ